eukprot:14131238-Alexandrium_andersonii.AAC.1
MHTSEAGTHPMRGRVLCLARGGGEGVDTQIAHLTRHTALAKPIHSYAATVVALVPSQDRPR